MADPLDHQKIDDLTSDYANNTTIQATVWDLKLIFGEFSQFLQAIEWHTAITMPVAQAKLLAHYLEVNVAVWELKNGFTKIPEPMLPQPLPSLTEEQAQDPTERAKYELIKAYQEKFVARQKAQMIGPKDSEF